VSLRQRGMAHVFFPPAPRCRKDTVGAYGPASAPKVHGEETSKMQQNLGIVRNRKLLYHWALTTPLNTGDISRSKNHDLTETDKDALYVMPDDWFRATDLPYPRVTRAEYRCERLHKAGYLEWRVVGAWPDVKSEYRKIESVNEALKGHFPQLGTFQLKQ
jgi:hypothetical protein